MLVKVERRPEATPGAGGDLDQNLGEAVAEEMRRHILCRAVVKIVDPFELPRSFGKTKRVLDERNGE
jgi:phenylacetate-CoA ligase